MNSYDLLEAMGEISGKFVADAQRRREAPPARRPSPWKIILLAAALAVMLMGCAVVYTLRDLKMGEMQQELPGQPGRTVSILSLQGYQNSPGYKANEEWEKFVKTLDTDYAYYAYHHVQVPEAYASYGCKTQEEIDKVDELCKKYKLNPRGKAWRILDASKIFEASGIRGIEKEGSAANFDLQAGGCYADGSFAFRGSVTFPGQKVGDMLNYNVVRKDSFDISTDAVEKLESYDDWTYTTSDGVELLLAASTDEAFMFADLDGYFIRVRLIAGDLLPVDTAERRKVLESRAECFDFTIRPGSMDTGVLDRAEQEYWDLMKELDAGYAESFRFGDYQYLFKNNPQYMNTDKTYALADLDGDGFDELILTDIFGSISDIATYNGTETSLLVQTRLLSNAPYMEEIESKFWLAEDGTLVEQASYGQCWQYSFFRLENGTYQLFDFVEYHAEDPAHWARSTDGDTSCEKNLTEDEAEQIISACKPMKLDFKAVSEFPTD